jgi:hypothetical protein
MFSKHVWYDRKHQAEVFITTEGVVSGTILAHRGSVCVVNPRPEILSALYQEAKIKRILSLKTIILTDNTIDYARGLCALLNYSRGLRRHSPLTVVARADTRISTDFLTSCCSKLLNDSAHFKVTIERIQTGDTCSLGEGTASFERMKEDDLERNPRLVVRTDQCVLHYLDETHSGASEESAIISADRPNVVIRTAEIPRFSRESRHMLTVLG